MENLDYTKSKKALTLRLTNSFFSNLDHTFNEVSDNEEIQIIKSEDTKLYKLLYELLKIKKPREDEFLDYFCFLNTIKLITADFICYNEEFHFIFIENIYEDDSDYKLDGISIEELTSFCNYYNIIKGFDNNNAVFDYEDEIVSSNATKDTFNFHHILYLAREIIFKSFENQIKTIMNELNVEENKSKLTNFLLEENIFLNLEEVVKSVDCILNKIK